MKQNKFGQLVFNETDVIEQVMQGRPLTMLDGMIVDDSIDLARWPAHVLGLCDSEAELQRCGQELMLYQERDLFDLLRYLAYLVGIMRTNHIIWGVGRGSSVASHVLYKLGVHRINSLHYNLDIQEFLR
jgi:hypothetical protein